MGTVEFGRGTPVSLHGSGTSEEMFGEQALERQAPLEQRKAWASGRQLPVWVLEVEALNMEWSLVVEGL